MFTKPSVLYILTEANRKSGARTRGSRGTGLPRSSRRPSAAGSSRSLVSSAASTVARCPKPGAGTSSSRRRCAACSTGRPFHFQSCCRTFNRGSDISVHNNHSVCIAHESLSCTDRDRECFWDTSAILFCSSAQRVESWTDPGRADARSYRHSWESGKSIFRQKYKWKGFHLQTNAVTT